MRTPQFSSIQLLRDALSKRGYEYEKLVLNRNNYTRFIAPNGNVWFTANTKITYPFMSITGGAVSRQKSMAYELAGQLGVTAPHTKQVARSQPVSNTDGAAELLKTHAPLIIKPHNASLSRGVTFNVGSEESLQAAIKAAHLYSDIALVQQQVRGEEIRFTVLDGRVACALLRQTPRVVGDGVKTVKQLIKEENNTRRQLANPYITYPQLNASLIAAEHLDGKVVLARGEILELSKSTMIKGGASMYNVLDTVHPSYVATVSKLTNAIGKGFLVADIMIEDYRQPQRDDNYAFIEFNMAPVLKLYYSCRDGKNFDIVDKLALMLDRRICGQSA